MKKILTGIIAVILGINLLLTGKSIITVYAEESSNTENVANTSLTETYIEKELSFEHKGFCEAGPWDLEMNKKGKISAFEWDTSDEESSSTDSYWVSLNKMNWSDTGKLSYQKITLSKTFAYRIVGGDYVQLTKQDGQGNLFVTYTGEYKKKEREMLTVLDNKGRIITDYILNDSLKHYDKGSDAYLCDIYITDSNMILYVCEVNGLDYTTSIQKFNWRSGKRLSTKKIEALFSPSIINGYVYGIRSVKNKDNQSPGSVSYTESLVKLSLDGKKELWSQKLPDGNMEVIEDDDMGATYNKFDYDVAGSYIYLTNTEGVYCADTSTKNGEFSLIMSAEDSKCLSENYTIVDLKVINKEHFYLLSIDGEDEEWPTDLCSYSLKKE